MIPSILFALFSCGEKETQQGKEITAAEPSSEPSGEDTADTDDTDTGASQEDLDGDGVTEEDGDCDDDDDAIYPGAEEIPGDGIDQDCDGFDEELDSTELSINEVETGDLVITEIMKDPDAVAQELGEWFEIYNDSANIIDLQNLQVRDDGVDSFVVTETLLINPGEYIVFGANGSPSQNGGAHVDFAYNYDDFVLGNSSDEIVLRNSFGEIDRVDYNNTLFPYTSGASLSLDHGFFDASANDDGQNWCDAQNEFGDGDLGTPAGPNLACPVAADQDGDGYGADVDCNDNNPQIHPGQLDDICNGIDANCDGNEDEDWSENTNTGQSYEPNQDVNTAYHLGSDPNVGGQISESTADLDNLGTIDVSAYIFDESDIDTYVFTTYDQLWSDLGFTVRLLKVPQGVDLAIAVDYEDQNGTIQTDIVIANDEGVNGLEELSVTEGITFSGYNSGTYYVRIYSMSGSNCSDTYELQIED